MRLLLDECVPKRLRRELSGHEWSSVISQPWTGTAGTRPSLSLGKQTERSSLQCIVTKGCRSPREWPAFRASRMRTVKSFEQEYIRVSVCGANEANIAWVIEGYPFERRRAARDGNRIRPTRFFNRIAWA